MEGAKRILLGSRKKPRRRKNRRFVRNLVAYLNSDDYLFSPLFANSESSKANDISMAGIEALEMKRVKRKMSEKVKEYLKSDCHMYGPVTSSASSIKAGKLQITNLVTMEVSTSTTTTMREDNNKYSNLQSDITEQTLLHNGRIKTPKEILGGQQTGLSHETDHSPPEKTEKKMSKPEQRRVTIE
ncbi:unnamed protein product [Arabis nemorensis]|uniref:Uncharacterized protein n=1 Tax=Arabis nemorensis TaxID=586526 RepID=A0A565CS53_9BRAS|nr:unnamed protein product [Arabis nemorensis]